MQDTLRLYGYSFSSRILLGTARYESPMLLVEAINAAEPAMVTVALRRQIQGGLQAGQAFWEVLRTTMRALLPNTAGCYTVKEAVNTALMARGVFETGLLQVEGVGRG